MASKKPTEQLFPSDYWKRPNLSAVGDSDGTAIFTAVGQALTSWEYMEEQLAYLCMEFSNIGQTSSMARLAFQRVFGCIASSSGRREAMAAAAEIYFWPHDPEGVMMKKLTTLLDNVSKASKLRDDIAHGVVSEFSAGEKQLGIFLLPSGYKTDRNKAFGRVNFGEEFPWDTMPGLYRYNSTDILEIRSKFEKLMAVVCEQTNEFVVWKARVASPAVKTSKPLTGGAT